MFILYRNLRCNKFSSIYIYFFFINFITTKNNLHYLYLFIDIHLIFIESYYLIYIYIKKKKKIRKKFSNLKIFNIIIHIRNIFESIIEVCLFYYFVFTFLHFFYFYIYFM